MNVGAHLIVAVALSTLPAWGSGPTKWLHDHGKNPVSYVLEKTEQYPIVLLGEAHWIRHDAELVRALVPELARREITLAIETLPEDRQREVDRLIGSDEWDEATAMAILRRGAWPYREYLEILHEAWRTNRQSEKKIRVLTLGAPPNWRTTLLAEKGLTPDAMMAERITTEVESGRRVLVYLGLHHAFTRYQQPELDLGGRALRFIDRTGNILHRRYGERTFTIALHRPLWCGATEPWTYCLPVDGRIDCAASELGRPVGFDVAGSPFAEMLLGEQSYYGRGHPSLRLIDFADGWIWFEPIEATELVSVIPLDEFAPTNEAVNEVIANNPLTNETVGPERLRTMWNEQIESFRSPLLRRGWSHLREWEKACR